MLVLAKLASGGYDFLIDRRIMKKFEKAVAVSAISMGIAGGMLAVEAHVEHVFNTDKRDCYTQLDAKQQNACLADLSSGSSSEQLLEVGAIAGLIGAVAAGVQAYRALAKES
jgi:hypothetical protein